MTAFLKDLLRPYYQELRCLSFNSLKLRLKAGKCGSGLTVASTFRCIIHNT